MCGEETDKGTVLTLIMCAYWAKIPTGSEQVQIQITFIMFTIKVV